MSEPEPLLRVKVVGCGNPLREDDGVGIVAVRLLRDVLRQADLAINRPHLRLEVVEAGRPGLALLDLLEQTDVAVLVDAIAAGATPGTIHRLDGLALAARAASSLELPRHPVAISSHYTGIAATLALAHTLNPAQLPGKVIIWGVEPASVRFGEGLTPEVAAALPSLVARLYADLDAIGR